MLVQYPRRPKRTTKNHPRTPPSSSYSHSPVHSVSFTLSDVVRRITLEHGQKGPVLASGEPVQGPSSGFSSLPAELLAEIFVFCLPSDPFPVPTILEAPLSLTHVCSQWRSIALSTPQLWSALHINYRDPVEDIPATELWLSRSGTCPLSLSIAMAFHEQPQQDMLDLLCRFSHRWRHIRFDFSHLLCPPMYDLDGALGNLPLLETFEFHARDVSDTNITPITSLLESAPQLRELTWVDDMADTETLLQLPLSQLTRLSLSMEHGTLDYLQLLHQCSNLEHIRITRPVANSLNHPSPPPVYLSKLTSLNISYDLAGILDHLILPALRSVRIYSDLDKNPSALPYMQSTHVHSYPHLPLPSSHQSSSTATTPAWNPSSLLSLIDRSTCSVTDLSINAPMDEDHLLQCLRHMSSSLTKLVVKGVVVLGDEFVKELTLKRKSRTETECYERSRAGCSSPVGATLPSDMDDGSGCCPRLEEIELDTKVKCAQGTLAALVESRLPLDANYSASSRSQHLRRPLLQRFCIMDGQKDIEALRDLELKSGSRRGFTLQVIPRKTVKKDVGNLYMYRRRLCASR